VLASRFGWKCESIEYRAKGKAGQSGPGTEQGATISKSTAGSSRRLRLLAKEPPVPEIDARIAEATKVRNVYAA
jgi:hypothetical protein